VRTKVNNYFFLKLAIIIDWSDCEGRQNARMRVRFDKIFAYFSSNGKVRAGQARGRKKNIFQTAFHDFPSSI
jgi:hypothetical protein